MTEHIGNLFELLYSSLSSVSNSRRALSHDRQSNGNGSAPHDHTIVFSLIVRKCSRDNPNTAGGIASFSSGSIVEEKIREIPFYVESPSSSQLDEETVASGPSKITGCHFDGNTATEGGAIYTAVGYDMVADSLFTRNYAGIYHVYLRALEISAGDDTAIIER